MSDQVVRAKPGPAMHTPEAPRPYGVIAEFPSPETLLHAIHETRGAGYEIIEAYTPFPIEEVWEAIGHPPSKVPLLVLIGGILGCVGGYSLCVWTSAIDYPINIGGRPFHSWPAFIPVTFEVGILFGALGAVFGMFALNRLPMHSHPLFKSRIFERVTDDAFFISIESWDPKFDPSATGKLLESLGARRVELVES